VSFLNAKSENLLYRAPVIKPKQTYVLIFTVILPISWSQQPLLTQISSPQICEKQEQHTKLFLNWYVPNYLMLDSLLCQTTHHKCLSKLQWLVS